MRGIGFQVKSVKTTGVSVTRFLQSTGHSYETISKKSPDEKLRVLLSKSWLTKAIKELANELLDFFGIGLSLKGRFVKK
jgi:hypothetical protein